ncbi:MAG: ABC transporter substrate-binding protein [Spirochaetes bacterium]|nr:ABC transporter substrate-binding protein [Spirochaetota bacterium]
MKKIISVLCAFCLLIIFTSILISCGDSKKAKIIKIGLISSVTGPMAPGFKSMVESAKPTADLINSKGGLTIDGQKYNIEIITADDQSSPPGAVAAFNKLLQEEIKFVLPPIFMPSDMAITPIARQNKIVRMKAQSAGRTQANPQQPYSFLASTGVYNIDVGYQYLKKLYPKAKRIAIVTPDDPGAQTYQELTKQTIKKYGFELVFFEAFKMGGEDFYPILTKALATKPDVIDVIFSIIPWSAGIINQSRELGFKGPIIAPAIFGDINILNSAINPKYAYDIFHIGLDVQSPKMPEIVKEFKELVEESTGKPLDMDHVVMFEAVYTFVKAIEHAQTLDDADKFKTTFEKLDTIDTIFGKGVIDGEEIFNVRHVVRRELPFSRIMNGKVEFEWTGKN